MIHDRIINNLNDIKYECTQENTEVLTNFAHTFPANQELFQNIARKYQQEWKEGMNHTNWDTLIKYMGELNNFFPVEEEAA